MSKQRMEEKIADFYARKGPGCNILQELVFRKDPDPFYYKGYEIRMTISTTQYNLESGVVTVTFTNVDEFVFSQSTLFGANLDISIVLTADPGRYRYKCMDHEQSEAYSFLCDDFFL